MSMMWVGIGTAVVGAGTSIYGASQANKQGAAPTPRDLSAELGTIANQVPTFAQLGYNNQALYNGQLTALNQNNFNNAMRGNFDIAAFERANPGFTQEFMNAQANGQLGGWTPEQYAMAVSNNDASRLSYTGGFGQQLRSAFNTANPELVNYTNSLGTTMRDINANAPGPVAASGYNASGYNVSGYNPTQAQSFTSQGTPFAPTNYGANVQAPANIAGPQEARDVTAMMVNPETGYDRVNGNLGFERVNGNMGYDRVAANTGFNRVRAQNGDIGLSAATQKMLTGGPSDIQRSLEDQARSDLALGGALSQEQIRNSQQAAREAGAARGLINSNSTIAAEILNRDAASNARLNERRNFAAAVDNQGFGQRQQGFANALGVSNAYQNYGQQGLAAQQANLQAQLTGNAQTLQAQQANQAARAQANSLALQGQVANQGANQAANALNLQGQVANQGARQASNAIGLQGQIANQGAALTAAQSNQSRDLSMNNQRFQVAQANQNAALQNNQLGLGYAGLNNQAFQSNLDRFQQNNQFNANLGQQNSQFNAGALNNAGQFNATAANAAGQFNSTATNDAARFNAGTSNQMNQFNAQLQQQNNNDAWNRAMGYGSFLGQQAINPMQYYGLIQGTTPDYTSALLGYGSDLNNTNYNAQAAANINQRNNSTALVGSGLGLIGNAANAYGNYAG